jgi:hypothetical protein
MVVICTAARYTDAVGSPRYVTSAVLCTVLISALYPIFFTKLTMPAVVTAQSIVSIHSSDHWDNDLANPRQWSTAKKWQAMGIVRNFIFHFLRLALKFHPRFHSIRSLEHWQAL